MKTILSFLFIFATLFIACRDNGIESNFSPDQPFRGDLTTLEKNVVSADNSFGLKLFTRINEVEQDKNVLISPFSVSMALGMTLNGADGRTLDSMKKVLEHSNFTMQEINDSYRNISSLLTNLDTKVTLNIANSVWYRNNFEVLPTFLNDCRTNFNAEVTPLDFSSPGAVTTINNWVNSKTNGKIPTILDQIQSDMVMYLINAVYFKGNWTYQFDSANTKDAVFTSSTGITFPCKMMSQHTTYAYYGTEREQVIDLPYGDRLFSMTIILPATGTSIEQYAANFTQQQWDALVSKLDSSEVDLFMPKLKLEYKIKLNDELIAMGMGIAFSNFADFSRIAHAPLAISEVKHKTFIEVNEVGTEAAAVTSVGIRVTAVLPSNPRMIVDHPFVLAIRERKSGTILFIGKIASPFES